MNDYNPVTYAWIGNGARINEGVTGPALAGRSLTVHADASTELLSIVGTVGIGGTAGVGGAADVVVMDKETAAWIGEGVIARTGSSLAVGATSAEAIRSVGVGLSAGGTAGVQGSASVLVLDIDTLASVKTGSTLFSDGNLVIAADADSDLDLLAGAIGAAGTAAVGAGAAVAVVDKTTHAWIDDGAAVTALGNATAAEVADGGFDIGYVATAAGEGEVAAPGITPSDGENDLAGGSAALDATRTSSASTSAHRGLAVTALNRDDIKGYAVTGAAAGTRGGDPVGEVSVHQTDTRASIGSIELAEGASHTGVQVNADNTGANAAQSVRVAAGNDSFHLGIAGALSASGTVGVGVGADVAAMQHATHAAIVDQSAVNAKRDVEVAASSSQEVVSISASLGASGTVGVAGQRVGAELRQRNLGLDRRRGAGRRRRQPERDGGRPHRHHPGRRHDRARHRRRWSRCRRGRDPDRQGHPRLDRRGCGGGCARQGHHRPGGALGREPGRDHHGARRAGAGGVERGPVHRLRRRSRRACTSALPARCRWRRWIRTPRPGSAPMPG